MTTAPILAPVIALVLWTCAVQLWMVATRLPAMTKLGLGPEEGESTANLRAKLPPEVQRIGDNYNHLMEHPTIFYATALTLAIAGAGTGLNLTLAWAYVGLRVVHSLIQGTFNKVMARFSVFALSSVTLLALAVNAARAVF